MADVRKERAERVPPARRPGVAGGRYASPNWKEPAEAEAEAKEPKLSSAQAMRQEFKMSRARLRELGAKFQAARPR